MTLQTQGNKKQDELLGIFEEYQSTILNLPEPNDDYSNPEWIKFHALSDKLRQATPKNMNEAFAIMVFALEDMYAMNHAFDESQEALHSVIGFLKKQSDIHLNPEYQERFRINC